MREWREDHKWFIPHDSCSLERHLLHLFHHYWVMPRHVGVTRTNYLNMTCMSIAIYKYMKGIWLSRFIQEEYRTKVSRAKSKTEMIISSTLTQTDIILEKGNDDDHHLRNPFWPFITIQDFGFFVVPQMMMMSMMVWEMKGLLLRFLHQEPVATSASRQYHWDIIIIESKIEIQR